MLFRETVTLQNEVTAAEGDNNNTDILENEKKNKSCQ